MARIGKNVNISDPIYALDKNRGFCRIPSYNEEGTVRLHSLKFRNREAYDNHIFELEIEGRKVRLHKDEFLAAIQYV